MAIGLAFWIIMLVWAVFFLLTSAGYVGGPWSATANTLLLFVLFGLLGWGVFGPPLRR
jgi:hypothetical protein